MRLLLNCHPNGVTTITLMGGTQTQEGGWEGSSGGNGPCEIDLMKGIRVSAKNTCICYI